MNRYVYLFAVGTLATVLLFLSGAATFRYASGLEITPGHDRWLSVLIPAFIALIAVPSRGATETGSPPANPLGALVDRVRQGAAERAAVKSLTPEERAELVAHAATRRKGKVDG